MTRKFLRISPYISYAAVLAGIAMFAFPGKVPVTVFFISALSVLVAVHGWYLALVAFLAGVLNQKKTIPGILSAAVIISFLAGLAGLYSKWYSAEEGGTIPGYLSYIALVPVLAVLCIWTKKYLYARSWWYLILEVLVPVAGLLSLSPALLEEENERGRNNQQ